LATRASRSFLFCESFPEKQNTNPSNTFDLLLPLPLAAGASSAFFFVFVAVVEVVELFFLVPPPETREYLEGS